MPAKLRSLLLRSLSLLLLANGCKRGQDEVHRLWPEAGAPDSETRRGEPETSGDWWVANVHDPSLTVFKPRLGSSSGAAVIVIPGGGHQKLVYGPEGLEPARFLARHGVTAFVLKYRLGRESGSPYTIDQHARADCLRAIRWVRGHASTYDVAPERVGVMGWSAGAELAAMASYGPVAGNPQAADPLERINARPDFQIVIYPGPLGVVDPLPPDAPPAFLLAANDDETADTVAKLLSLYRQARLPVEVHLYAQGGHAFNMGQRSHFKSIRQWPERLLDWLREPGWAR